MKKGSKLLILALTVFMTNCGGGGDGGGSSSGGGGSCVNVAGTWNTTEQATGNCAI